MRIPFVFDCFSDRDSVWHAFNVENHMQGNNFAYGHRSGKQTIKKMDSAPRSSPAAYCRERHHFGSKT